MPWKQGKAIPKGDGPIPHQHEFESRKPTMMADFFRMFEERFDRMNKNLDKTFDGLMEKTRDRKQRLAGLEHEARQPRLAMGADIETDKKTRKRTEDAAADRTKHGVRARLPRSVTTRCV